MNINLGITAGLVALAIAGASMAQTADAPMAPQMAMKSLAGDWTGALEYRDYQSGTWYSLPVTKTIANLEDGATQLETARYDDGPKTGMVYIYSLSAFEPDGVTLASASFRKGKSMSTDKETARFSGTPAAAAWTLILESTAEDDSRPAKLRVTMTYTGQTYSTLKEVDFTDDAGENWIARNRSTMRRVEPAPGH